MPLLEQHAGKAVAGELRALVGIEDFRHAVGLDGLFQTVHTEPGIHRVRQPPCQYLAAVPIDDRDQIDKAVQQPNIGDVGAPHLVGADDIDAPEQVRINLVLRMRLAGVGAGRHACQAQCLHQAPHPLAIDGIPTAT